MPTARIWSYREPAFSANLRGYEVEALDGRIGTVAEAPDDARGGYLVVDTGPWVFRKKVMLPAGVIDRVDRDARRLYVNRTKEEIKNAPEFGETGYDDDAYRIALGRYYGSGGAGFRAPPPRDTRVVDIASEAGRRRPDHNRPDTPDIGVAGMRQARRSPVEGEEAG